METVNVEVQRGEIPQEEEAETPTPVEPADEVEEVTPEEQPSEEETTVQEEENQQILLTRSNHCQIKG